MNNVIYIFFLFTVSGCTQNELAIDDLKFDNIERTYIKANNVNESIIIYDSLNIYNSIHQGTLDRDTYIKFIKKGYGTGYIKYDTNGNIIDLYTREFMGTVERNKYDSLQLPIQKNYETDFIKSYNIHYFFDKEKLNLFQYWQYGDELDTTIFSFNDNGYVIEETGRVHDDKSRIKRYKKDYFYTSDTLKKVITAFFDSNRTLSNATETLFYKDGIISKREILNVYLNPDNEVHGQVKKITKLYDDQGLPIKVIQTFHNGLVVVKLINNK